MTKKSCKKKCLGFSLIEMSIVLAIVGAVLATIWVVANNVREEQRENDAATELQTIVHNITTLKQTQRTTFTVLGDITANMASAGVRAIPQLYINVAGNVVSSWGRAIVVTATAARTFRVSFNAPPIQTCTKLLLQGTACDPADGECPSAVHTNNASVASTQAVDVNVGWRNMTPVIASTMCNDNPLGGGSVDFDYTF